MECDLEILRQNTHDGGGRTSKTQRKDTTTFKAGAAARRGRGRGRGRRQRGRCCWRASTFRFRRGRRRRRRRRRGYFFEENRGFADGDVVEVQRAVGLEAPACAHNRPHLHEDASRVVRARRVNGDTFGKCAGVEVYASVFRRSVKAHEVVNVEQVAGTGSGYRESIGALFNPLHVHAVIRTPRSSQVRHALEDRLRAFGKYRRWKFA